MRARLVCLGAVALGAAPAAAQQPAPPPSCSAAEYRQFDFWVGTWDVLNPQGQRVGGNTIDTVLGGCALHEQWRSAGANAGFSYNMYDRRTGRWHQTWVDNNGLLLVLDGGLDGTSMVLSGPGRSPQGQEIVNRITWTPLAADSVRQRWEVSADGGGTWRTVFDGRYVRRR